MFTLYTVNNAPICSVNCITMLSKEKLCVELGSQLADVLFLAPEELFTYSFKLSTLLVHMSRDKYQTVPNSSLNILKGNSSILIVKYNTMLNVTYVSNFLLICIFYKRFVHSFFKERPYATKEVYLCLKDYLTVPYKKSILL
jgi:hypothetical protein